MNPKTEKKESSAANDEARVTFTERMLSAGLHKSEVKAALQKEYGVRYRTSEDLIARARAKILASTNVSREEHVAYAYSFYRSVLSNPEATIRDQIKAQDGIVKLLGLNAPVKVAQTNADGSDISPDEARAKITQLYQELRLRIGDDCAPDEDVLGQD